MLDRDSRDRSPPTRPLKLTPAPRLELSPLARRFRPPWQRSDIFEEELDFLDNRHRDQGKSGDERPPTAQPGTPRQGILLKPRPEYQQRPPSPKGEAQNDGAARSYRRKRRRSRGQRKGATKGEGKASSARPVILTPGPGARGFKRVTWKDQQPPAPPKDAVGVPVGSSETGKPHRVVDKEAAERAQSLSEGQRSRDEKSLKQKGLPWYVEKRIQKRADRRANQGQAQQ